MTVLFSDTFESNNFSAWDTSDTLTLNASGDGSTPTTTSTGALVGTYSALVTMTSSGGAGESYFRESLDGTAGRPSASGTGINSLKFKWKPTVFADGGGVMHVASLYNYSGGHYIVYLFYYAGFGGWVIRLRNTDGTEQNTALSTQFSVGTAYDVELVYDTTGSNPVAKCYVNGVLDVTPLTDSGSTPYAIDEFRLGGIRMFGTNNITALYDTVSYANAGQSGGGGLTAGTASLGSTGLSTQAIAIATNTGGTSPYSNQLQRAPDVAGSPGSYANVQSPAVGASTSITDTGLTPGTKYWWHYVVTDNASATSTSNAVTTTIPSGGVTNPSPAKLVANTTLNIVKVLGVGTSWGSGTTWSVSGMTGCAVTARTFVDTTHYTLEITSSTTTASGTLTLTNSADASTASITVTDGTGTGGGARRTFQG